MNPMNEDYPAPPTTISGKIGNFPLAPPVKNLNKLTF
jgi:hypothetical protein